MVVLETRGGEAERPRVVGRPRVAAVDVGGVGGGGEDGFGREWGPRVGGADEGGGGGGGEAGVEVAVGDGGLGRSVSGDWQVRYARSGVLLGWL